MRRVIASPWLAWWVLGHSVALAQDGLQVGVCDPVQVLEACPTGTVPEYRTETRCDAGDILVEDGVAWASCGSVEQVICRFLSPCSFGVAGVAADGSITCLEPMGACGDGVCTLQETSTSCPVDCNAVCIPNSERCDGAERQICSVNGQWANVPCPPDTFCYDTGEQTACISCDPRETWWFIDADGDGKGSGDRPPYRGCVPPTGYVANDADCDDTQPDDRDAPDCSTPCYPGCAPGLECRGDACVCIPNCDGTRCGDDGCGSFCRCPLGEVCDVGECVAAGSVFAQPADFVAICADDEPRCQTLQSMVELAIDDYVLDTIPVSAGDYEGCVAAGQCGAPFADGADDLGALMARAPNHDQEDVVGGDEARGPWVDTPLVVGVSWNDARAYCNWKGLRLPTEFELQLAVREGRGRYRANRRACLDACADRACRRACRAAKPRGLDAIRRVRGVWEWTADAGGTRRQLRRAARGRSIPPVDEETRMVRGWGELPDLPDGERRWRRRAALPPDIRSEHVGFRCAQRVDVKGGQR